MSRFLAVLGSVTSPGRLSKATEFALESLRQTAPEIEARLLNLADRRLSFADGRPASAFADDTPQVVQEVLDADMYLIVSPIYRASLTGALKNLLDLVPVDGLMGKACGLMMMGATDHHYLVAETQLRPVLAWFGAHVLPVSVYLTSRHFKDGVLTDADARHEIRALVAAIVALNRATSAMAPPELRPLAARGSP